MSIIKVDSIQSSDGNTDLLTLSNGAVSGVNFGRRNLIINGAMQVAQRGTSVSGITGGGYYTCDRWDWYSNCEETITQSQSTDAPDGFSNSLKVEVTTAETTVTSIENARIQYGIEGQDLQHLAYGTSAAKSITISFWVKSSVTGDYSCSIQHIDVSQYYSDVYTINSANTWEYKTITVPGYTSTAIANDNTEGMRINFGLTSGTDHTSGSTQTWGGSTSRHAGLDVDVVSTLNATWQITGVQLEVGSVATPFEHRSYGEELTLCQRYFERMTNETTTQGTYHSRKLFGMCYAESTSQGRGALRYATKRSEPTISYNAVNAFALYHTGSTLALAGLSFDNTSLDVARILLTSSGTPLIDGSACHFSSYSSSTEAYVDIDAEL
jgi:hypothetical protein